jgi:release factor glutamine methyltransferase
VLALDGGTDGLDAYRELLPAIATVLDDGGWSALEIDTRAAAPVAMLALEALGLDTVTQTHPDLTDRPRVVSLTRARR